MRDMERIKPKYTITMDNKQIVMVVIAFIVILGLVFSIGYVLGKNTKTIPQVTQVQQVKPQNAIIFTQSAVSATTQTNTVAVSSASKISSPTTATTHTEMTFYKSLTEEKNHKEIKNKVESRKPVKRIAKKQTGRFNIQCGAYRGKREAEASISQIKKRAHVMPWIESVTIRHVQWYRVKIGHFGTKEQALRYEKIHLKPNGLINCIVTSK
ncbi:MAG: SPOR domain-containing protein [Deltaproteobacteria bacterium]|nr:SPOR domain-containing protein [Deltaproteobacteria bacterium]